MAISLALQNTKAMSSGNISCLYLATMTSTYPSGGYTVNAATYPGAAAKFKSLKRVRFERDNGIDSDGNFYKVDGVDNSDATDPLFKLHILALSTGGITLEEKGTGVAHAASIYLEVEGIPAQGVDGDNW